MLLVLLFLIIWSCCSGDACVQMICPALENALKVYFVYLQLLILIKYTYWCCQVNISTLKLKGNVGSKRQHVHGCSLVRARRFYGYDASEQLYAKLYLYPSFNYYCFIKLNHFSCIPYKLKGSSECVNCFSIVICWMLSVFRYYCSPASLSK